MLTSDGVRTQPQYRGVVRTGSVCSNRQEGSWKDFFGVASSAQPCAELVDGAGTEAARPPLPLPFTGDESGAFERPRAAFVRPQRNRDGGTPNARVNAAVNAAGVA